MTDLIDAEMSRIVKEFLAEARSGFLHTAFRYVLQLERERDGLRVRCEQLRRQLEREAGHAYADIQAVRGSDNAAVQGDADCQDAAAGS